MMTHFKKTYFFISLILLAFLGSVVFQRVEWAQEAQADAVGTLNVSATCQAAPVQVWTSGMNLGVVLKEDDINISEINLALNSPVNNDSPEMLSETLIKDGDQMRLLLATQTPTYKMTGLYCRPYIQARVNSYGDAQSSSLGTLDVAFDSKNSDKAHFDRHHQIDSLGVQNSLPLLGVGGVIKNTSLVDGADFGSPFPDGQIVVKGENAGIIKTILNLRDDSQNKFQPIFLSMQAY